MLRPAFESYNWNSDLFNCQSNDIDLFYSLLNLQISRLKLEQKVLGNAGEYPLLLLQSPNQQESNPNVLISAGFHGEEPAGPWGMLHFLMHLRADVFATVNLTLLPLVNPTGFEQGHRFNELGQNPNRGFPTQTNNNELISHEGALLIEYVDLLIDASKNGVLTCHEDVLLNDSYIYSFEEADKPSALSQSLRDSLGRYFATAQNGEIDGCTIKDGIIFNHFDTSFESFLVERGAKFGCCSETPGQQNFDQRVKANAQVMQTFILALHNSG